MCKPLLIPLYSQVHSATKDAIRHAASVLLTEINSVTDNPTVFPR